MIKCLIVLAFRIVGIFLVCLFLLLPLFKQLFKICFRECKQQKKDIEQFLEDERMKDERQN